MRDIDYLNNFLNTDFKNEKELKLGLSGEIFYYRYGDDLIKNFDLIDRFKYDLNWSTIGNFIRLSEEFMDRYSDKLDWISISQNQILSEDFIRRHKYDVSWVYISGNQLLSRAFLEEFKDKVEWDIISAAQELDYESIKEFKDCIKWNWFFKYRIINEELYNWLISLNIYIPQLSLLKKDYPIEDFLSKDLMYKKSDYGSSSFDLYSLYQQTKDRGWFIGYIKPNVKIPKKFETIRDINNTCYYEYYGRSFRKIFKVRVHWKDLKFIDVVDSNSYEIIREVKNVQDI